MLLKLLRIIVLAALSLHSFSFGRPCMKLASHLLLISFILSVPGRSFIDLFVLDIEVTLSYTSRCPFFPLSFSLRPSMKQIPLIHHYSHLVYGSWISLFLDLLRIRYYCSYSVLCFSLPFLSFLFLSCDNAWNGSFIHLYSHLFFLFLDRPLIDSFRVIFYWSSSVS